MFAEIVAVGGYEHEKRCGDELVHRLLGVLLHLFYIFYDVCRQGDV